MSETTTSDEAKYPWLKPGDSGNPFPMECIDVRALTLYVTASTGNPAVAQRFGELRRSDGREFHGRTPDDPVALETTLVYPLPAEPLGPVLYRAAEMEEKWDVYFDGTHAYLTRSWTGQLAFVLAVAIDGHKLRVTRVTASRPQLYGQESFAARVVDFIVRTHVLEIAMPHPLPEMLLGKTGHELALFSFSQFGRVGQFGSFEDTTMFKLKPRLRVL